jgi:hypothetical protein
LRSDVNAIAVAYSGRCDMLRAIFGGEKKPTELPAFGPGMLSRGAS